MKIDPLQLDAKGVHDLLVGCILPRPIAFVSTVGADGIYNLAPYSFFTAVSANPPILAFAPQLSAEGRRKDRWYSPSQVDVLPVHGYNLHLTIRSHFQGPGPKAEHNANAGILAGITAAVMSLAIWRFNRQEF